MSKKLTSPSTNPDDRVAEFADQVLSGQLSSTIDLNDEDEEMRSLAQIMTRLDEELRSEQPGSDMAKRIKANLITEWHKSDLGDRPAASKEYWWNTLAQVLRPTFRRQQAFTLALVAVIVIGLAAVALSPLASGTALPGTADGNGDVFPAVLLIGLMVLGVFVWLARRRQ